MEELTDQQIRNMSDEQLQIRRTQLEEILTNLELMLDMVEDTEEAGEEEEDDMDLGHGNLDQLEEDLENTWEQHAQVSDELHRRILVRREEYLRSQGIFAKRSTPEEREADRKREEEEEEEKEETKEETRQQETKDDEEEGAGIIGGSFVQPINRKFLPFF
jgi:hypothetical protein